MYCDGNGQETIFKSFFEIMTMSVMVSELVEEPVSLIMPESVLGAISDHFWDMVGVCSFKPVLCDLRITGLS